MNKNIHITAVTTTNNMITVHGTFGTECATFEATPFQWGGKMLMKVSADGLDRGTRVAIGIKSKAAMRFAVVALPVAIPKRAPKVVAEVPVIPKIDYSAFTVKDLRTACKEKGLKGYSDMKKADIVVLLSA